jgi:hypothetical protein
MTNSAPPTGPADTGDVQDALDARETQAVGGGEECGGRALAVGGEQLGDVTLRGGPAGSTDVSRLVPGPHTGLVRATVSFN